MTATIGCLQKKVLVYILDGSVCNERKIENRNFIRRKSFSCRLDNISRKELQIDIRVGLFFRGKRKGGEGRGNILALEFLSSYLVQNLFHYLLFFNYIL